MPLARLFSRGCRAHCARRALRPSPLRGPAPRPPSLPPSSPDHPRAPNVAYGARFMVPSCSDEAPDFEVSSPRAPSLQIHSAPLPASDPLPQDKFVLDWRGKAVAEGSTSPMVPAFPDSRSPPASPRLPPSGGVGWDRSAAPAPPRLPRRLPPCASTWALTLLEAGRRRLTATASTIPLTPSSTRRDASVRFTHGSHPATTTCSTVFCMPSSPLLSL